MEPSGEGSPLVDLVVLVSIPDQSLPTIVNVWPESSEVNDAELPFFTASVVPIMKKRRTVQYCFNTPFHYCFSLFFETEEGAFSVVLVTTYPCASFFSGFFNFLNKYFQRVSKYTNNAKHRFDTIVGIVEKWPRDRLDPNLHVKITGDEFQWSFTGDDFTFADYDPSQYFDRAECEMIWRALFRGEPILIVGKDCEMTTHAIFSAMALMSPLRYCDPICMSLSVTDPRFVDVVNEESDLKIVGTDCVALCDGCNFFKYVFYLNDNPKSGNDKIVSRISLRMKRAVSVAGFMLDNQMLYDATCDIIEKPMYTEEFGEELKGYKRYDLPTGEDFMKWEDTDSFKTWRRRRNTHESFRDALLSNEPERIVTGKTKRQLLIILKRMMERVPEFDRDEHVKIVLKKDIAYLKHYLKSM